MAEKTSSEVAPFCRDQFEKGMAAYNRQPSAMASILISAEFA